MLKAQVRVRVYHRALGEVLGNVLRRVGDQLLIQFDGHETPLWVSARFVSEVGDD